MGSGVILIKRFVADYCNKSNRRQEKTMPETVFCLYCMVWFCLVCNSNSIELLRTKHGGQTQMGMRRCLSNNKNNNISRRRPGLPLGCIIDLQAVFVSILFRM